MKQQEFEQRLLKIKEQEKLCDVKINISQLIDKDHLDCTWYGGEVGTIEFKDGTVITIGAYGDIRLYGAINGVSVDIEDKNNSGRVYEELGRMINDEDLKRLTNEYDDKDNYLEFWDNNWFEVDLITPDGKWVDLWICDNILDGNLLECFEGIDTYLEFIAWWCEEDNPPRLCCDCPCKTLCWS